MGCGSLVLQEEEADRATWLPIAGQRVASGGASRAVSVLLLGADDL